MLVKKIKLKRCEVDSEQSEKWVWFNDDEYDNYIPIQYSELPKLIKFLEKLIK